ncbi:hypothetical protein PCE1_004728 [Barthelona sp. PCE]
MDLAVLQQQLQKNVANTYKNHNALKELKNANKRAEIVPTYEHTPEKIAPVLTFDEHQRVLLTKSNLGSPGHQVRMFKKLRESNEEETIENLEFWLGFGIAVLNFMEAGKLGNKSEELVADLFENYLDESDDSISHPIFVSFSAIMQQYQEEDVIAEDLLADMEKKMKRSGVANELIQQFSDFKCSMASVRTPTPTNDHGSIITEFQALSLHDEDENVIESTCRITTPIAKRSVYVPPPKSALKAERPMEKQLNIRFSENVCIHDTPDSCQVREPNLPNTICNKVDFNEFERRPGEYKVTPHPNHAKKTRCLQADLNKNLLNAFDEDSDEDSDEEVEDRIECSSPLNIPEISEVSFMRKKSSFFNRRKQTPRKKTLPRLGQHLTKTPKASASHLKTPFMNRQIKSKFAIEEETGHDLSEFLEPESPCTPPSMISSGHSLSVHKSPAFQMRSLSKLSREAITENRVYKKTRRSISKRKLAELEREKEVIVPASDKDEYGRREQVVIDKYNNTEFARKSITSNRRRNPLELQNMPRMPYMGKGDRLSSLKIQNKLMNERKIEG